MSVTLNNPFMSKIDEDFPSDKRLSIASSSEGVNPIFGAMSLVGRKRKKIDVLRVAPALVSGKSDEFSFYAIFHTDGSVKVVNGWRDRLHSVLLKQLAEEKQYTREGKMDWVKVMRGCFAEMNEEELKSLVQGNKRGVMAMVVVVTDKEVILAVTGNSMAVLYRDGSALLLSHKFELDRADKRQRDGDVESPYIPSVPEVTVKEQTVEDEFLIIASSSLWEIITEETAYNITKTCLDSYIRDNNLFPETGWAVKAAAVLSGLAVAKGGQDNMSVVVVHLKTI